MRTQRNACLYTHTHTHTHAILVVRVICPGTQKWKGSEAFKKGMAMTNDEFSEGVALPWMAFAQELGLIGFAVSMYTMCPLYPLCILDPFGPIWTYLTYWTHFDPFGLIGPI